MNNKLDFTIRRLGECRYKSPIELSYDPNDLISDFVADDERILYHSKLYDLQKVLESGDSIPAFEAAGPRDCIFFDPKQTTAAVVTCGGLCPGINNVIRGIVHSLYFQYRVQNVLGIQYGFKGLVESSGIEPIDLTPDTVEDINSLGGTMLGSSRGPQSVSEMVDFLENRKIDLLFTIGGDGTQRGALELTKEIERRGLQKVVVGIPKTIDNDVKYLSKSFGFETACSIATDVLRSAHAEANGAYNGITVVKLMGRHSGFLAASAAVASGEVNFVLVPEVPIDMDLPNGFLGALEQRINRRHHALVAVAEGAGQEFLKKDQEAKKDPSGNVKLGDIGEYIYLRIQNFMKERGIEAGVRYIDPSYYVRSVPANANDSMYCLNLARNAVHAAMSGRTAMIVGFWNGSFTHVPIEAAVSERKVIDPEGDLWLSVLEITGQPNRMINESPK